MSATGRGSDRIVDDGYPSPRWTVDRLLEAYSLPGGLWLEPCAGSGAIIRAVSAFRDDVRWHANELQASHLPALLEMPQIVALTDGNARMLTVSDEVSVIITNPPFVPSMEILEQMLRASWALTIFLQRLNWAAGPRRELFRKIRPSVYVLPDRPSFCDMFDEDKPDDLKAQTDATEYCWFAFDGRGDFRILADTPAEVRRAEIEEGRANGTRPKKMSRVRKEREAA